MRTSAHSWSETILPSGIVSVLWSVFPLMMAVSGHLTIGDGVQAMGKTAIAQDIEPGKARPSLEVDEAGRIRPRDSSR